MTKNAMLSQDGSIIRGSKITYQIGSQKWSLTVVRTNVYQRFYNPLK